jgi:hypothetical protein
MMKRIIDHKRVDMSDDEWKLYEKICKSYNRPNFEGKSLFEQHFEVNDAGIIVFVLPPQKKRTSLEVYCFLTSVMVNQHTRLMHAQVEALVREAKQAIAEAIASLKSSVEEPAKK